MEWVTSIFLIWSKGMLRRNQPSLDLKKPAGTEGVGRMQNSL